MSYFCRLLNMPLLYPFNLKTADEIRSVCLLSDDVTLYDVDLARLRDKPPPPTFPPPLPPEKIHFLYHGRIRRGYLHILCLDSSFPPIICARQVSYPKPSRLFNSRIRAQQDYKESPENYFPLLLYFCPLLSGRGHTLQKSQQGASIVLTCFKRSLWERRPLEKKTNHLPGN